MIDENRNQALQRYESKRTTKKVSFNQEKEADLLAFANSVDFSQWVKEQIRLALNQ